MQHLPMLYWTRRNETYPIPNQNCNSNWRRNFFFILPVQSYSHTCIAMCINNDNWIRPIFINFDFHRLQQSYMEPDMLRNLHTNVYKVKTLHGGRESKILARIIPYFKNLHKKG